MTLRRAALTVKNACGRIVAKQGTGEYRGSQMYESFFGFREKPFNITPDPKYLYLSEQHQEAVAHLLYGIQERGGFVVITGEIGTGKTTLCRYLLNQMDERTEGAIVFNPNLSEMELLKSINEDFGIISTGQTKKELIDELNQFLLEERLRGKNMVLIIDEAQNLQPAVLEQVRMLSNLETEKEKLIQIILIGQPQLKKLLARAELRQLDQRVTARYHLNPLNRKEVYRYIQHRLDVASNGANIAFEPAAMRLIYKFSGGIPRLINVVCDRALLGAFAAGQGSPIPSKMVKQAIREVTGPSSSRTLREKLPLNKTSAKVFVYSFAVTLALILGWYAFTTFDKLGELPKTEIGREWIPDFPVGNRSSPAALAQLGEAEATPAVATNPTSSPPVAVSASDTPTPAIPYSHEQKAALIDSLLSQSYAQSRLSAVQNLLSLWGSYPPLRVEDVASLYGLAVSQNMRCTELWTNFEGLRCFNSACILEMFVPHESRSRYVVLTGLEGKTAKILYGDAQKLDAPVDLLDEFWLRRAFVFWKDFERVGEVIKPGDRGAQVVWLQASLQKLGLYNGELAGVYDAATEEAVREFQEKNKLLLDGVVGPQTKLALFASLDEYPMPRLNGASI